MSNDINRQYVKQMNIGKGGMGSIEKGDRQSFLDVLRILATCGVVLLHTVTGVMDHADMSANSLEYKVFLVIMDFVTWGVPIFILISGYLFLNPAKEITFRQMLKKYCRRIALALVVFGVPYVCLELVLVEGTFRISMLGQAIWMVLKGEGWSHMWYLYMILLLYLITPVLKWGLQKAPRAVVYAILAVLLLGSSILPFINACLETAIFPALPGDCIYLFYYLCGYLFVSHNAGAKQKSLLGALGGEVILLATMLLSRTMWDFPVRMAYNYPFTVLFAILLFGMGKHANRQFKEKRAADLQKISSLCFAIYLLHPVFVNTLYKFLHITPLDFPIGISLPGFFLIILGLSLIGAWILCRIPLLRKYVL